MELPSDEFESRANLDSQFIDFEERCAECLEMFCFHELRDGCRGFGYYCRERCSVFALPEKDEGV